MEHLEDLQNSRIVLFSHKGTAECDLSQLSAQVVLRLRIYRCTQGSEPAAKYCTPP